MSTRHQAFARIVETCQPGSVVACGDVASDVATRWCESHPGAKQIELDRDHPDTAFPLSETQDLALVSETLEHLSHEQGLVLLGQLRNYGTHQIAVIIEEGQGWTFKDFIGLGFRRQAEIEESGTTVSLFTYNIDNYNHKRAWKNPQYWANPEMWGKAWW